jgi:hypothetical protein
VREGLEKYGIGEEGELLHLEPGASVENDDGADDLLVADLLEQLMQSTFRSEAAAADADT